MFDSRYSANASRWKDRFVAETAWKDSLPVAFHGTSRTRTVNGLDPGVAFANAERPVTRIASPTVNPRTSAEVRRTWPRAMTARAQYPIAKAPTMDSPGSSGFCGETAARIPWRASTTTAGPTNGNALSCAGGDSIGIASGKPWNPWAVKNPRPRSGLGAIVGAPQCFWVFIIDCGVECHF